MQVLNFGSLNYDYVYTVEHILKGGETISSYDMKVFYGGKGLNQSIALARAGVSAYLAGTVGEDGEFLIQECQNNGILTAHLGTTAGRSGHTIIQVDKDGQNCILLFGGANKQQQKERIDQILTQFNRGDFLLLQNEINYLDYIIEEAYKRGMVIALNPSPYNAFLDSCDFSKISLFFINEIEGCQMTGKQNPEEILNVLKELYPQAEVVLTLGSDGSVYQKGDVRIRQPIYPVKAVDTTAAGDTFTGYFISGYLEKAPVKTCLERAAKAASIAVSRAGATASIPTRDELHL